MIASIYQFLIFIYEYTMNLLGQHILERFNYFAQYLISLDTLKVVRFKILIMINITNQNSITKGQPIR